MRHIVKGFDVMYPADVYTGGDGPTTLRGAAPTTAELEAWRRPKHPTKSKVKLVDSYAIKPDLEAFPDSGTYMVVNLIGNPTNNTRSHDTRVDVGLLHPEEIADNKHSFEFYLPKNSEEAKNIKSQFDSTDPDRDDPSLRTTLNRSGIACSRYDFHRTYDMYREVDSTLQPYKEVALALHDPGLDRKTSNYQEDDTQDKAAYYYPIGTKMQLKPRRNKNLAQLGLASQQQQENSERADAYDLVIRDADQAEIEQRESHREELVLVHVAEGLSQ